MAYSSGGFWKWFLLGGLALFALAWFTTGGRARLGVVQDKVNSQLDKVLGDLNVKEKQIDMKRQELSTEMNSVRAKMAGAAVRYELLLKKQEATKQELEKLKLGLERVKPKMDEAKAVGKIELNGREVSAEELNRMASELVSRAKSKESQVSSQQTSIDALKKTVDFLSSQENAALDILSKLDLKVSEIKDKRVAIDAVKTANGLGQNDSSLTDKIGALSKEIDNMFVDVETTMRVEEGKLNDLKSQTISADELLTETGSDLDTTMGEIDAILGKGDGK
jgi:chromosome segregation ATPase